MRAFLGNPVAEPALGVVVEALAGLRRDLEGVRWVRPEGLHLSVHFFGQLPDDDVEQVVEAVSPVAARTAPFELRLGRYGAFRDRGQARVLWLGVDDGVEALARLAMECRQQLSRAGYDVDSRPYSAHCTLGRPRPRWPASSRRGWEAREAPVIPPYRADRLVLYESHPGPGGSRYLERVSLPFSG